MMIMYKEIRKIKEDYNYDFSQLLINENMSKDEKREINLEIENIAEVLYKQLKKDKKINTIQKKNGWVPIATIAQYFGFKTKIGKLTDIGNITEELAKVVSGFISITPDNKEFFDTDKVMVINSNESQTHCRFTIAHELAHYIFDFNEKEQFSYSNTYRTDDYSDIPEEVRANRFAAAILMPNEEFVKKYNEFMKQEHATYYECIKKLSEHFFVSATAVVKRIDELKEMGLFNE